MKWKVASILLASLLLLMISPAQATVYQGSCSHSWAYPTLTLSVAIDTDANIWTAKWDGEPYLIDPPSIFVSFKIKFEDDKGFSEEHTTWGGEDFGPSGTFTIEDYTHTNTWTKTKCTWTYFFPLPSGFGFVFPELWINLYIGDGDGDGNGGGGYPHPCPTLFVWDGSQYVEEALLDIHADSDITLQHMMGEQALVPDKNFYKLSLRELDEFTSHIDYTKLYVVDLFEGKMHEAHLTNATHSQLGDVKELLLHDDETRVDLTPEQTIDLKFTVPKVTERAFIIFEINGYNMKTPIDEIPP